MINFDSIFPDLNCDALAVSQTVKQTTNEVPSSINFIEEDKASFIKYCESFYGTDVPMSTDNDSFRYYGTTNGYRLYRIAPTNVPSDTLNVQKVIGGYTFESSERFRPSTLGLYIIGQNKVLTLEEAYEQNLIDISKIYKFYSKVQ